MRPIDADKILAEFPVRRNHHDEKHGNMHFINGIETVMEYLDEIADTFPIHADPVRHEEWLESRSPSGTPLCYCSICGDSALSQDDAMGYPIEYYTTDFCPNCGAKMDGCVSDETIHDKK
ncbi:MAG: hypothetical protein NC247_14295 [Ruminococcus flavefaciens]|jgi:hypothetical protein|nr:hypothetical protein [Ruminococcus flavefaciens]MCM1363282.1 hypothetical protein [Clostridiales bacterium]